MAARIFGRRVPWALVLACLVVTSCLATEGAARWTGVGDFPVYAKSPTVGYIPAPSQAGAFLNRRHWVFNERSMGIAQPFRATPDGVLLIGDSIVQGGNPLDQQERLGHNIASHTGCPTWPIAAGSWALNNELAEILSNRDFLKLGTIVFVSNSEDFGRASVWTSEYTHPTRRPWSVALYALRRKLWPVNENTASLVSPEATTAWQARLAEFLRAYPGRILWVTYPRVNELQAPSPAFTDLRQRIAGRATMIDPARDRRWSASFYRDVIHPTAEGNRVLGRIIAERLPRCGPA